MPWGALISGAMGALGSLFGSKQQNRNVNAQIKAQREENEKARKHNLYIAKQQNQWNVDQWNRENQYNDPSAQMARYKAAGLNPNLIYGQTNTAPQLSGALTSGASAVPADMSALGSKKSGIASVFDAIRDNPFAYEQLRGMRLANDEKEEDIGRKKSDNSFTDFLRSFDPEGSQYLSPQWEKYRDSAQGRKMLKELDLLWYNVQQESAKYSYLDEESRIREIESDIRRQQMETIQQFARTMDINESDAETFIRSMLYTARGIKADALNKEAEAVWNDPSFLEKLPAGLPKLLMFLRSLAK